MTYELRGLGLDLSPQAMGQQVASYLDPMMRTILAQEGPKLIAQAQPMVVAQIPSFVAQVKPAIQAEIPGLLKSVMSEVQKAAPQMASQLRPTIQLELSKLTPTLQAELIKLRPTLEAELSQAIASAGVDRLKKQAVIALAVHASIVLMGVLIITAAVSRK